jgi:hypothetical protein
MTIKKREKLKRDKLDIKIKGLRNDIIRMQSELLQKETIINELKAQN